MIARRAEGSRTKQVNEEESEGGVPLKTGQWGGERRGVPLKYRFIKRRAKGCSAQDKSEEESEGKVRSKQI